jgi:hypothetical protein
MMRTFGPSGNGVPLVFYFFVSTFVTTILSRRAGVMLNLFAASAMADFSSGASTVPRR